MSEQLESNLTAQFCCLPPDSDECELSLLRSFAPCRTGPENSKLQHLLPTETRSVSDINWWLLPSASWRGDIGGELAHWRCSGVDTLFSLAHLLQL